MTPHARISAMIDALRPGPVLEAHADLVDILDAINDRIGALERSARADRLQQRPFKAFAGLNNLTPQGTSEKAREGGPGEAKAFPGFRYDVFGDEIHGNATLNESRQPGRRKK